MRLRHLVSSALGFAPGVSLPRCLQSCICPWQVYTSRGPTTRPVHLTSVPPRPPLHPCCIQQPPWDLYFLFLKLCSVALNWIMWPIAISSQAEKDQGCKDLYTFNTSPGATGCISYIICLRTSGGRCVESVGTFNLDIHQHKLERNCSSYCISGHHLPTICINDLRSSVLWPVPALPDLISRVKPFLPKLQTHQVQLGCWMLFWALSSTLWISLCHPLLEVSWVALQERSLSTFIHPALLLLTPLAQLWLGNCIIVPATPGPKSHLHILAHPFCIQSSFHLRTLSKWAPSLLN